MILRKGRLKTKIGLERRQIPKKDHSAAYRAGLVNSARERTRTSTACNGHMALNHARLPIPPLGQTNVESRTSNVESEGDVSPIRQSSFANVVTPAGFEPATHGLKVRCSARLSYEVVF